jgi:hypothetical protein
MAAVKPICFMIMPYGTKQVLDRHEAAVPAAVNFDHLWQVALRPAIEDDLGYEPVRADEDLGALIIHEMIERLAISDLVIADVSIANANVYYEIGIRHAARQQGSVMVAAEWAKPLFDINQMRQVRYPLPDEVIDDATATQIRRILKQGVPRLADAPSPFYMVLPGYPDKFDVGRASSFRDALLRLSRFQAAVTAVRAAPEDGRAARALRLRDEYYRGGPVQRSIALELLYLLRDYTNPEATLQFIESLPEDLRAMPLIFEQVALLQSQSGDHVAAIGALEELIRLSGDSSERRGLLGGRYKRLYLTAPTAAAAGRYLDLAIENYDLGMHLDLNDYYPASNLPRLYQLRKRSGDKDRARVAAAITLVACQRAVAKNPSDPWVKSTMLAAAFDAGDVDAARQLAADVGVQGPAAWKLSSVINDLELALRLHDAEHAAKLRPILLELQSMLEAAVVTS